MPTQQGWLGGSYSDMIAELAARVQEACEKLAAYVASRQEPRGPTTDGLAEVSAILAELSAKLRRWQRQGSIQVPYAESAQTPVAQPAGGLSPTDARTEDELDSYDDDARPIEEELMELARQVPDEEWRKLPDDLSENVDHYVYGTPKR